MNQGIPKPLRNALARQGPSDAHPSPDVLTSFMERTLPPGESEVVTHHLAQCAECREIVFLASSAAEDEVPHVEDLVAAAASARAAAMPAYAAMRRPDPAQTETPRSKWTVGTRWVVAVAAAVVLVSGGLVVQSWRAAHGNPPAAVTVADNRPAPASSPAQPTVQAPNSQTAAGKAPAPEKSLAKAVPQPATIAQAKKAPAQTAEVGSAVDQAASAPAPAPENAAKAKSSDAMAALGGTNSAMVPEGRPQSARAESAPAQRTQSSQQYKFTLPDKSAQQSASAQSAQLQKRPPALFGKPAATEMDAVSAVRPQWRVAANGHLERSMAANQWTRVLDDQSVTFHAVAVIGSDVWAGGNGGALFHSSDGGEHWSKVSLGVNSKVETGVIVSIRFDDVQHGTVASDNGNRWMTTDGGVTWTTQ